MIDIETFIKKTYGLFQKEDYTTTELKKLPAKGISVPSSIWGCYVEGSKPKKFSIKTLAERSNVDWNNILSMPHTDMTNDSSDSPIQQDTPEPVQAKAESFDEYIPHENKDFLPIGDNYSFIEKVIASREFFPTYIWGISGVGKTSSIEYACAKEKRPFFRAQITSETVDDDLIGSLKLVNGSTEWQDGPVLKAYRSGGVLVLDEVDLNSSLMVLQGVLECKPFYVKQTAELVYPQPGFQVFATGNSKGDGSAINFVGTSILNEAFLERFAVTIQQDLLPIAVEKKIAKTYCSNHHINVPSDIFSEVFKLVSLTRERLVDNGYSGMYLSTRRIHFIFKAYSIVGDINTAIRMTTSRYAETEREALSMLWKSIHADEPAENIEE